MHNCGGKGGQNICMPTRTFSNANRKIIRITKLISKINIKTVLHLKNSNFFGYGL